MRIGKFPYQVQGNKLSGLQRGSALTILTTWFYSILIQFQVVGPVGILAQDPCLTNGVRATATSFITPLQNLTH